MADHWLRFNIQSKLGEALAGQKKYAVAESLLLDGYQGMKEREDKMLPKGKDRLNKALKRLINLYDSWGKSAEATAWQKQLEALQAAEKNATGKAK